MRYHLVLITFLLSFFIPQNVYAFDWKKLHETSQEITLAEAKKQSEAAPNSIEDLYILGLVYLDDYNYTEALKIFETILRENSENIAALWGKAEILRKEHEYEKCVPIFRQIIESAPEFGPAYVSLAYTKYMEMDFKGAAALTRQVHKLDQERLDLKTRVQAHSFYAASKGMMAHYGGPFAKSANFLAVKKHLKIAQELQPHSVAVYFGYGNFYMSIPAMLGNDIEKAEKYFEKTIEIDPRFADAYARLAQIYRKRGDMHKYDQFISKALKLDPKSGIALDIINRTCHFICLDN